MARLNPASSWERAFTSLDGLITVCLRLVSIHCGFDVSLVPRKLRRS